jgi:hypothetical protein
VVRHGAIVIKPAMLFFIMSQTEVSNGENKEQRLLNEGLGRKSV